MCQNKENEMALSAAEKQKAYRIRQQAKKQAQKKSQEKKYSRQLSGDKWKQTVEDTDMILCLQGNKEPTRSYCGYDGEGCTVVGIAYGPSTYQDNALVIFNECCDWSYLKELEQNHPEAHRKMYLNEYEAKWDR